MNIEEIKLICNDHLEKLVDSDKVHDYKIKSDEENNPYPEETIIEIFYKKRTFSEIHVFTLTFRTNDISIYDMMNCDPKGNDLLIDLHSELCYILREESINSILNEKG